MPDLYGYGFSQHEPTLVLAMERLTMAEQGRKVFQLASVAARGERVYVIGMVGEQTRACKMIFRMRVCA